jgi:hypothetical protein
VVPQVLAAREAHQRSLKLLCFTQKILLQQYLHISEVPILPTKVGYEGQSGSDGDIVKTTRLTRS